MAKLQSSTAQAIAKPNNGLLYDIDECPPLKMLIPLSIQNLCAMFGATILVPILVNAGVGSEVWSVPVAICMSGVGTLIYQICTRFRSPVYLGSSFAFIAPMIAGYATAGIGGVTVGLMAVGLIYVIVALLILLAGTDWLDRVLPPVVVGGMIMVIGFGLAPSAIGQMGLDGTADSIKGLVVAFVTLGVAILVMMYGKGFWGIIPFLVALATGYVLSVILGLVDFTPVREASWIQMPGFQFPFVHYSPNFGAIWQIAPIAIATIAEHIGDHEALSEITGRDLLRNPGLVFTLIGDGLATFVSALFCGPSNTTYGENSAVAGITRVASVRVLTVTAFMAIGISFLGKFAALISTLPSPVLGGVSILLYGFIGINGAKVWVRHKVDFGVRRNVIIAAMMLGFGLGGAVMSIAVGKLVVSFAGMSLAAIFGVLINLLPKSQEDRDYEVRRAEEKRNEQRLKALLEVPDLVEAINTIMEVKKDPKMSLKEVKVNLQWEEKSEAQVQAPTPAQA